MSETQVSSGGIGFLGLLAIMFIGLKLMGYIHWSWWWVLAPLWGCWLALLVVLGLVGVVWWGLWWWSGR